MADPRNATISLDILSLAGSGADVSGNILNIVFGLMGVIVAITGVGAAVYYGRQQVNQRNTNLSDRDAHVRRIDISAVERGRASITETVERLPLGLRRPRPSDLYGSSYKQCGALR